MDTSKEDTGYIFFWRTSDRYGVFSQWYPSTICAGGHTFTTAEQFMMFEKALFFNNIDIAKEILYTPQYRPWQHKKLGRSITGFNYQKWHEHSIEIVANINYAKFTQNPWMEEMLLNTGDSVLVEASATDRVWGIGFTESCALLYTSEWGENKLGRALMIVRSRIREEHQKIITDI